MFLSRAFKVFLIVIVVFVFAGVANAFADANTFDAHVAGEGSKTISGYAVTDLTYVLNYLPTTSTIKTLSFSIATSPVADADEIQVSFDEGANWFECDENSAPAISCDIDGGATVLAVKNLTITGWGTP